MTITIMLVSELLDLDCLFRRIPLIQYYDIAIVSFVFLTLIIVHIVQIGYRQ